MFEECRLEGEFTLSSGRQSNVFYDFDLLLPTEAAVYMEKLVSMVPKDVWDEADFIAAPAMGGIVPGFLAAFATKKPLVLIDKEGKPRGPEFKTGKYVIVDDVITSFGAVNLVRTALPRVEVVAALAYIFRGSRVDLGAQDYPVFYLTRKEQEI